jgi:hypothetical protein
MWLALCDCYDWGAGELQLSLRNDQYSLQIRCERKFVEALQLAPMPKGMKPLTGGEFAQSTSQSGSLLWCMITKQVLALTTVDAKTAWSFFVRGEALLQLSFVFDEGGSLAHLVGMDVEVMVGVIKLLLRSMNSRQLLAVAVYISGASCDSHRAVLLVSNSRIIYYDPAGDHSSQATHHRLRGLFITSYLRRYFESESCTDFSSV